MKKSRTTMCILWTVLLTLALTLAGCTTTGKDSSTPANDATTTPQQTKQAAETPVPTPAYEKVTLSAIISQNSLVSDLVNNTFTEYLEELTNVHLDMTVVPSDGYGEKLVLALGTGDYPEVIMSGAGSNNSLVVYGIQDKIYIPINPYLDEYAPNITKCFTELPYVKESLTAPDGNIYGLPIVYDTYSHASVSYKCWINTDWLALLRIDMPTTTEEFKNVLMAFKTQDPNGNGLADEVPMSGAISTWAAEPYLFLLNAFGYYNGYYDMLMYKNGDFTFTADTDYFREGLRYIKELYVEQLIDPASLTQDMSQLQQLGNADPTVLGCFTAGHIAMGLDITNVELSSQYSYLLPLEGPTGYRATPVKKMVPSGAAFAVTDKCQNPEAAVRVIDAMFIPEVAMSAVYGPKGVKWDDADSGAVGFSGEPATWKVISLSGSATGEATNDYWAGITGYWMGVDSEKYCQFDGDIYDPSNYVTRLNEATNAYIQYAADADQILPMWCDSDTSAALNNSNTLIKDYVNSSIVEFITGRKDLDRDWQDYIDGLDKLGYIDYVASYKNAYMGN